MHPIMWIILMFFTAAFIFMAVNFASIKKAQLDCEKQKELTENENKMIEKQLELQIDINKRRKSTKENFELSYAYAKLTSMALQAQNWHVFGV